MKIFLSIVPVVILTLTMILPEAGCIKAEGSNEQQANISTAGTSEYNIDEASATDLIDTVDTANKSNITEDASMQTEPDKNDQLLDYSIIANDEVITIFDWDNETDLYKILGDPVNENIQKLESADTFTGCFVKTLKYEGLEIALFSPPENGKTFWILDIKVSNDLYPTFKGIKVGDSLENLKNEYPAIQKVLDGRTDDNNCSYEIVDQENNLFLQFEIKESIIQQIDIFHEIN